MLSSLFVCANLMAWPWREHKPEWIITWISTSRLEKVYMKVPCKALHFLYSRYFWYCKTPLWNPNFSLCFIIHRRFSPKQQVHWNSSNLFCDLTKFEHTELNSKGLSVLSFGKTWITELGNLNVQKWMIHFLFLQPSNALSNVYGCLRHDAGLLKSQIAWLQLRQWSFLSSTTSQSECEHTGKNLNGLEL